jgi:hypothetical protein
MGRKSALTDKQWAEIEQKLLNGAPARQLAREYEISEAAIRKRLGTQTKTIKTVADQMVNAELAVRALPISAQISARTLAEELLQVSTHLLGAARFGAATAHRLSGIANARAELIADAGPLSEEGRAELTAVSVLTKMANDASEIGVNLLKANKDTIDDLNKRDTDHSSPVNPARGTVFKIVRPA